MSSLPPELLHLLSTKADKPSRFDLSNSRSSGGFVPYSMVIRRAQNPSYVPLQTSSFSTPEPAASTWVSRHQVKGPEKTAWLINDRGNRVWFSYEHSPTIFPVHETRFYKPKLHRKDFLNKKNNDQDDQ